MILLLMAAILGVAGLWSAVYVSNSVKHGQDDEGFGGKPISRREFLALKIEKEHQ